MGEISEIGVKAILQFSRMEELLREVTVGYCGKHPYGTAGIALHDFSPEQLNLTTSYLLRENLLFQEQLHDHLLEHYGIDTFRLQSLVILDTPEGEMALCPPIVEHMHLFFASPQQAEQGCTRLSLDVLLDGAHRSYLAKRRGESITCVHLTDVDELYQVPIVPNSWNEVMVVDQLPERRFKKRYLGDSLVMYRDFSALGSHGYRGEKRRV